MKILVVSNMYPSARYPDYGTFVKSFVDLIERLGVECSLAVMRKSGNKILKALRYGCFYIKAFAECILQSNDLVYIHYASFSSLPVLAAKTIRPFPYYVNVHGSDVVPNSKRQERMSRITGRAIAGAEKIIVPSRYFKTVVQDKYKVPENKLIVFPSSGVKASVFFRQSSKERLMTRTQFRLGNNDVVVGFVGRLIAGKGWKTYLEACARLSSNFKLLMIGDGDDSESCASVIRQLRLEERVTKLPALSQSKLNDAYNAMDLIVVPSSSSESLCLVALEALSVGTPVVSTNHAGMKDYIEDGYNGFFFPVGDDVECSNRIMEWSSKSAEEKELLSKQCVASVQDYSAENCKIILREMIKNFQAQHRDVT